MIEVNPKGEVVLTLKGDVETYHDTFRSLIKAIMLVDSNNHAPQEYFTDIANLLDQMYPNVQQLQKGLVPK